MTRRKRVLFVSEASYLATGYATYSREVLKRLHDRYDVAELSVYGQVSDPRRKDIPWKNYPNQPSNEEQRQQYTQSLANQFGAWRFERACLDFKPDVVCFPPETPILTSDGYKPIVDIVVGDSVCTHTGRYNKVLKTYTRDCNNDLITIQTSHYNIPVSMTDEHPVLVLRRHSASLPTFDSAELEWLPAKNVIKGDLLVYPRDGEGVESLDQDLCRLIGYHMAEGCLMYEGKKSLGKPKGIQLNFHINEKEYIEDYCNIVKKLYNVETTRKVIGNGVILRSYSHKLHLDMKGWCGELSGEKRFSSDLLKLNNKCVKSLLCGLFRGDGGYDDRRGYFCTKSEQLSRQIFHLCARLGILCSFNRNNNTINDRVFQRYMFSFAGENYRSFVNVYENLQEDLEISCRANDDYLFLTVKKIEKTEYDGRVHNIEVENDNSYVTSFCVHNCDIRDHWMMSFERTSPFRRIFNLMWMPTVDAAPQAEEWLATYSECDGVVTYSQFAYDLLKKSCGSKINLRGVASPCACEDYVPGNNIEAKKALGINPEHQIIGTVMRNQRRKLFPDLFKAFADFIKKTDNKNVYLYCHTGYPDHGWDFSKLLIEYGISSRVYFTYKCRCGYYAASKFADVVQQCPSCKNFTFGTTNVGESLTTKDMAKVYQSFDLYCQAANSEGCGIPVLEAAACGIPLCCTDYSAMEDFKHTLTAVPIKVKTLYNELETGCNRAIIDTDHLTSIFTEFFRLPVELRSIKGFHTRKAYEKNYSWDYTVKQWSGFVDESPFADWNCPPAIRQNQSSLPKVNNNKELVDWAFSLSCLDGDQNHGYEYLQTLRDLNFGMVKKGTSGFFLPEFSLFDNETYHPMNPDILLQSLNNRINFNNYWERSRTGMISLPQEDWL